jgi:hypothetical protein
MSEPELDPEKVSLLQDLTTRHGKNIPAEELELNGISKHEYATWRMNLADDEEDLRDLRALSDSVEAGNQPGTLPPRRSPAEVAELERREEELKRREERRGEAKWEDDETCDADK